MTREDVKKIFPEATDEMITNFLNQSNSDVAKEKAKAQKLKEDAEKVKAVQEQYEQTLKELEELKQQNMTEAEKAEAERAKEKLEVEKQLADLQKRLAESEKENLNSKITSVFAKAGLTNEAYASLIKAYSNYSDAKEAIAEAQSFVDGVVKLNTENLANAKAEWEQEKLNSTPNPGNTNGSNTGKELSYAAKFAKERSYAAGEKAADSQPGQEKVSVNF